MSRDGPYRFHNRKRAFASGVSRFGDRHHPRGRMVPPHVGCGRSVRKCYHDSMKTKILLLLLFVVLCRVAALPAAEEPPSFNRDIRPILAAKCFACHGPDESHREADLRLDVRGVAIQSGALVAGKPDESELIARIFSDDADLRMPPAKADAKLTDVEKQLLRRWVAAGAKYETHWAFVKPRRPEVPRTDSDWPRNAIDHFILARMADRELAPSPEADRYALARRLYLDLIGLPPTPAEADAFVNDKSPDAYEQLVDRLLASKHYGERWARNWLDLARYADTNGYEKDRPRSIWPYRDWVIHALNDDMPFDEFTIQQLAGDMLPNATEEQRIATGFHRNTMLNEEGGIDPLEYRYYAMVDRVATTGTVWLGLTVGCAQCHTHKYDPISHTEYYQLLGLLNNADEPDLTINTPEVTRQRNAIEKQIARLEAELPQHFPPQVGTEPVPQLRKKNLENHFADWMDEVRKNSSRWSVIRPQRMDTNLPELELLADGSILSTGDITKRDVFTLTFKVPSALNSMSAIRLEVLPDERLPNGGPGRAYYEGRKGDFFLSELSVSHNGRPVKVKSASHSFGKIGIGRGTAAAKNVLDGRGSTGWSTSGREGTANQLVLNLANPLAAPAEPAENELKIEMIFERHYAASLGRFRFSATTDTNATAKTLPVDLEEVLSRSSEPLSERERQTLRSHFLRVSPETAEARKAIDQLRRQLPTPPHTMVFQERPGDNPRPTFRHHRGEYLSPREEVSPNIPRVFGTLPGDRPANRLTLARWLVSESNPLAARVAVNRAWQAIFGAGLVRSSGDFGTQAEAPSHPLLLDWLATEFVANGWSMKKLHRQIVMSATYRQQSLVGERSLRLDPENRFLSRGARYRVNAEMVRDIMLKASGLLSDKMLGPSVYPPQPKSVTALAYGNTQWPVSQGKDRYRRSLYTFSKRTAPFAAFTVFDGPTGERCVARRDRSNTPLQALTLLNDEMYLEMARALAARAIDADGESAEERATFVFRRLLTRPPRPKELSAIVKYQAAQLARLEQGELKAAPIINRKDGSKSTPEADRQLAAWTMTTRSLMNLDEAITKP